MRGANLVGIPPLNVDCVRGPDLVGISKHQFDHPPHTFHLLRLFSFNKTRHSLIRSFFYINLRSQNAICTRSAIIKTIICTWLIAIKSPYVHGQ